eukprot:scaffold1112_cov354-Pavlova_lutheri.AAC.5
MLSQPLIVEVGDWARDVPYHSGEVETALRLPQVLQAVVHGLDDHFKYDDNVISIFLELGELHKEFRQLVELFAELPSLQCAPHPRGHVRDRIVDFPPIGFGTTRTSPSEDVNPVAPIFLEGHG